MPPWHADPRSDFANDPRLTETEIRTLVDWCARRLPEGEPIGPSCPRGQPMAGRFPGQTWLSRCPAVCRPAGGDRRLPAFEVDPGFGEDRWIQAAEIRPEAVGWSTTRRFFSAAGGGRARVHSGALGSFCLAASGRRDARR